MIQRKDRISSHVIFYFSGTGNTWWVAKELSQHLEAKGIPGNILSIEAVSLESTKEYIANNDLIGFGYPVHCSDLPQPMKDFIERLPLQQAKAAFIFCTQWLWSGDGAFVGADFLTKKGFSVGWGEHFLMPNNVCISAFHLPYTSDFELLKPVLKRARKRIDNLAIRISAGEYFRRGFNRFAYFLGALQRNPFRKVFHQMRDFIGIDSDRCRNCGMCIKICPAGNLVWHENRERITTLGICVFCMRCYCFCPHTAITYKKKSHNLRKGKPYSGPTEDFSWKNLIRKD